MKIKFLIDDYINKQTIIVAYLPKAKNKATKARCEISPMSTHTIQPTQYNPPQQHHYRLWAGKCQMVYKLLIPK